METPPLHKKGHDSNQEWLDLVEKDEVDCFEQAFINGYNETLNNDFKG